MPSFARDMKRGAGGSSFHIGGDGGIRTQKNGQKSGFRG